MSSHLGQGASGAADKNFAIRTFNSRLAAKARKKFDCLLEPLFKRARISRSMRLRHSMTDFTQNRFELLRAKALFYLGKNSVEERAVGLWKQFLALRASVRQKNAVCETQDARRPGAPGRRAPMWRGARARRYPSDSEPQPILPPCAPLDVEAK